jgi:hypothetical protein
LRFQFLQRSIQLSLRFAEASQMVIQADVCFASTAHDCFAVTNLAQKRSRPKMAARAVNVNSFSVEIDCHRVTPLIHAAYSSDWSWFAPPNLPMISFTLPWCGMAWDRERFIASGFIWLDGSPAFRQRQANSGAVEHGPGFPLKESPLAFVADFVTLQPC